MGMAKLFSENFEIKALSEINPIFGERLEALLAKAPKLHLTRQTRLDLKTAFYEAVANAIEHAGELQKAQLVQGKLFIDDRFIGFDVKDHGEGFDIEHVPLPDFNDYQSSGRGIFMMKQLGDDVSYKQTKSGNVLTFKRYLVGQDASTREIEFLYSISEAVLLGDSLESIYQMILDQAVDLFHVDRASVLLFDDKDKVLKVVASRGMSDEVRSKIRVKKGEGVSGYVFQHGRPLLIEDIDKNRRGIEKKEHYQSKSFVSVPLIYSPTRENEKIVGVINLTERQDGKEFTKKDLKLLSTIANQAMASLYIRDLMDDAKRSEAMKRQLKIVREIQESYLPKAKLEQSPFQIEGLCEMAESLGGDYYDYTEVGPWIYLVVADVSGHDIRSAMSMLNFRSQLRSLMHLELEPGELLTRLNQSLYGDLQRNSHFVTALLFRIHKDTMEWSMASAGHYPPIFIPERFQFIDSGIVLGVDPDEVYKNTVGQFEANDLVVLYTDGVIEAMNQSDDFFGLDRLKEIITTNKTENSTAIVREIVNQVADYRDHSKPLDDLTVLSLRCPS